MKALRKLGYEADGYAQEHSYLSIMWREVSQSAFLIYLDAFLSTIAQRLESHWEGEDLEEEWDQLHDACQHCDLTANEQVPSRRSWIGFGDFSRPLYGRGHSRVFDSCILMVYHQCRYLRGEERQCLERTLSCLEAS